jgi:FGGY-family pentulose kinase
MAALVAAVDIGTASARAGILDSGGRLLGRAEHPIEMNRPEPNYAEHDSEQIWEAACVAVRGALAQSSVDASEVAGISFDATSSLVVRSREGGQLSVSKSGEPHWDTIVWLDHRAMAEAGECTATGHRVLRHMGDVMSPEMEVPKLMWLRRHLPECWDAAGYFFDLTDFLTWRSTGALDRSQSTLTCKWTYLAHEDCGWQRDFLEAVGMADMPEHGRFPEKASPIGEDVGPLSAAAAEALGLTTACRVGVGLIDAHAGALGALGGHARNSAEIDRHLALVAGTSSCVMALSPEPRHIHGVWGPYFGAVLPNCWLNEGGQSATGALLDHIIRWHGAAGEPSGAIHQAIVERVMQLRSEEGPELAGRLHVLPDFHGNRSPLAVPDAVGVISGLTLDASFDSLCRLYWRTAVAIALGVRHILDTLSKHGYGIDVLHVAGGHTKNPLLMELYSDATGCTVIEPATEDATLLGTGIAAATGARLYPDVVEACEGMQASGERRAPNPATRSRFDRDYQIFLTMQEQRRALETLMR